MLNIRLKERDYLLICLGVILLMYSSYFIFGENSYLGIFDGLDSNHTDKVIEVRNIRSQGIGYTNIPQSLGGMPTHSVKVIGIVTFIWLLFPPYYADVVNRVIISLVAFFGMLLLLKHLDKSDEDEPNSMLFTYGTSLAYAICVFWPYAGISVAGLPLIFYAYDTADRKLWLSLLISVFYVFYSSLGLVGIFLLTMLGVFEIARIFKGDFRWKRVVVIIGLTVFFVLANIGLILSVINPLFVSHRKYLDMVAVIGTGRSIVGSLLYARRYFFSNAPFNIGHPTLIIVTSLITLVISFIKKMDIKRIMNIYMMYVVIILLSTLFINDLVLSFQSHIPIVRMLRLQRFSWLLLPIQYLILYEMLKMLNRLRVRYLSVVLLVLQLLYLFYAGSFNYKQSVKPILGINQTGVNYSEFYSVSLFNQIDEYIGISKERYRVVSVGLPPAIALYNGFYTIDGYNSNGYPLEHKQQFGKMMENELIKNEYLSNIYYNWGSKCYLFSDDIYRLIGVSSAVGTSPIHKDSGFAIDDLQIDASVLVEMNCQYVFSALPIMNHEEIDLYFEQSFENEQSPYRVFLYSVRMDEGVTG